MSNTNIDPKMSLNDFVLDSPQLAQLTEKIDVGILTMASYLCLSKSLEILRNMAGERGVAFQSIPANDRDCLMLAVTNPQHPEIGFAISDGHLMRRIALTQEGKLRHRFKRLCERLTNALKTGTIAQDLEEISELAQGALFDSAFPVRADRLMRAIQHSNLDDLLQLKEQVLTELIELDATQRALIKKAQTPPNQR